MASAPKNWPLLGASALRGRDPRIAALQYASVIGFGLFLLTFLSPVVGPALTRFPEVITAPKDNGGFAVVAIIAALWALTMLGAAIQFIRVLPDVAGRDVVEGRVVDWRHIEGNDGGEGPSEPDTHWIALDDGRSDAPRL